MLQESKACSHLLAHSAAKPGYQTERSFPMSSNSPTVASQLFLDPEEMDKKGHKFLDQCSKELRHGLRMLKSLA